MKLITKNSQIVPGTKYRIWNKRGEDCSKSFIQFPTPEFVQDAIKDGWIFELVSYPPRRPVTWEWVKENIDQVPGLKVWHQHRERFITINSARNDGLYLEGGAHFCHYNSEVLFIDPPHPEVPDVPAPWETKPEPAEEKKSLWWVMTPYGNITLRDHWTTEEKVRKNYHSDGFKYQPVTRPVHEGPDSDAWRSV